ncbi:MAG: phosphate signaling complex protein PhoU [Bacillota bacterium]
MRKNLFDAQVEVLNQQMIEMCGMIENTLEAASEVLQAMDVKRAKEIIEGDAVIDRKEREIESLCLRMLLTRQPVAHDLRVVSSALKMITDMERIADHAADISEIVTMIGYQVESLPAHFAAMSRTAVDMVHRAVDAYVRQDVELARVVIEDDDIVDNLFVEVKQEIVDYLVKDSSRSVEGLDFLMIAKYYERIGDHATNIAEWVEYCVTGLYKGDELR